MAKEQDTLKMADELGLNTDNIKEGLKRDKDKVSEAVKKAHTFMQNAGKKK